MIDRRTHRGIGAVVGAAALALLLPACRFQPAVVLKNPILFVTQFPISEDFATVASTFGNHRADPMSVGRGGDLYIRYPDGTLRNLTREAGYGNEGFQGAGAIAVREPSVHWDGDRALFSMVVGAPTRRYEVRDYFWQIYEITGLGQGESAVVTKIANQPATYNNVSPIYGTDGRVIFTSDRPRGGSRHLWPQHDEYESTATNTGLWSLDPATGDLRLLEHAPSGSFTPMIDSFGRVLFTRWDHLQRDQQADADAEGAGYGTFNYSDESAEAVALDTREEVFPEPRGGGGNLWGHTINHFFPWEINEDGTAEETLNHIGRHELHRYMAPAFNDDPNLREFYVIPEGSNPNRIENFLQIAEDPTAPGRYFGVDAPEFYTRAAGQIVSMEAPPGLPADAIRVTYGTHRATSSYQDYGSPRDPNHSGLYRDPLPLEDGQLLASHADEYRASENEGTRANPLPRYDFRVKLVVDGPGGYRVAGLPITDGVTATISYYDPDVLVSYSGPLWELDAVEVRPTPVPTARSSTLEDPELSIFAETGVDPASFRADLAARGVALIVSRDVTTRDAADRLQPYNLQVTGGDAATIVDGGRGIDLAHLQLFQGDQLRGIGGVDSPRAGRRVIAQRMHDAAAVNLPNPGGPASSVRVAADVSVAAIVPARRAMSWQLTDAAGTPVVRERYWLTFQPGEIR
ncbi:MAG: hypothetical protein KC466_20110, partial [Myxococcales bacterium]|nr:hypothetical protein [Myxococcales bacterium]